MSTKRIILRRTVCLAVLIALFALLSYGILKTAFIPRIDELIHENMASIRTDTVTRLFQTLTTFGNHWVALFGAIGVSIIFGLCKRWTAMTGYLWVVIGGSAFNSFLKWLFERPRPAPHSVIGYWSYSFPSGHAVNVTLLYGALLYFLWPVAKRWPSRVLLAVISSFLIISIGFSRIYLGVHWTSDVIAGFLVGGIWILSLHLMRAGLVK